MIDLHTHSTCSDGTLTPAEIVRAALEAGLSAVALTDHDTMAGISEFQTAARGYRVRAIAGVEISARHEPGEMHLLGYGGSDQGTPLGELLETLRRERERRNAEILNRLHDLGLSLRPEELGGDDNTVIGRLHIADALVRAGHVHDRAEAFERWLAKGRPAYVERRLPDPEACVECIRASGGVAVLAHPVSLGLEGRPLLELIRRLKDVGLVGLEVWHPDQNAAWRTKLLNLARDHGLIATGGSDFHGARTPGLRLGLGKGDLRISDDVLSRLLKKQ